MFAVDIGNSSTKIAADSLRGNDRWILETIVSNNCAFEFDLSLDFDVDLELDFDSTDISWFVSSVNRRRFKELKTWISERHPRHSIHLLSEKDVPLPSDVKSRASTGTDRLVAAWMAVVLNDSSGPVIVVDAGTAVTVDLVDNDGVFQGGVIFPGVTSSLAILSSQTDFLPDLSSHEFRSLAANLQTDLIGKSTEEAMVRGVLQSQLGSILYLVNRFRHLSHVDRDAQVYVTGGGLQSIQQALPEEWNFVPDLVLQGVREIGLRQLAEN